MLIPCSMLILLMMVVLTWATSGEVHVVSILDCSKLGNVCAEHNDELIGKFPSTLWSMEC